MTKFGEVRSTVTDSSEHVQITSSGVGAKRVLLSGYDGTNFNDGYVNSGGAVGVTDLPPSGAGANGTRDLTSANTWYAVPSTVPASPYVLVVAVETTVGTIRWGYDNTGTPSATNGLQAPSMLTLRLAANQSIYFASSTAGDDVNWTTKVI